MALIVTWKALRPVLARTLYGAVVVMAIAVTYAPAFATKHNDIIPGPVRAKVIRVIDGDSVIVRAHIWLGQEIETTIRLYGVDAPELRGRCPIERNLAIRAREFIVDLVGSGDIVLKDIRLGKYAGRVIARMETLDGRDCAIALIDTGLGRAYAGETRASWC